MKELSSQELRSVNGGVAPIVLAGYYAGGTVFGGLAAAGAIWLVKKLQ